MEKEAPPTWSMENACPGPRGSEAKGSGCPGARQGRIKKSTIDGALTCIGVVYCGYWCLFLGPTKTSRNRVHSRRQRSWRVGERMERLEKAQLAKEEANSALSLCLLLAPARGMRDSHPLHSNGCHIQADAGESTVEDFCGFVGGLFLLE